MFGPFASDVEKLALVCFCFVLFFAESTRVVKYWLGSIKTLINSNNTTLAYWKNFMLTWTIRLRTTTVHWFHHCEWVLIQLESGHFLTNGHFMSHPTAFHCRTPDLYWHFVTVYSIWLTSLKEIQTQFLSQRLFVHVPQYS